MSGEYLINPIQPKSWDEDGGGDMDAPQAFRQRTKLSQHISFLKDFFRCYKDFDDRHIDAQVLDRLGRLAQRALRITGSSPQILRQARDPVQHGVRAFLSLDGEDQAVAHDRALTDIQFA